MKKWSIVLAALFATSLFVHVLTAADNEEGDKPRPRARKGRAEARPKRGARRPGMGGMMLMRAIDANHDGVLSAEEIAGASAALKKLDKNEDGKIDKKELQPPRPQRRGGEGEGGDRKRLKRGDGGDRKRLKRGDGEGGRKRPDAEE